MFSPFPDRLLLSGARRPKPESSELFECRVYIRHSSAQSAISVISTSYEEKGDEGVSFLETPVSKNETQFGPPKAGGFRERDFCRSKGFDAPNKFVFPIHMLRRPRLSAYFTGTRC